MRWDTLRRHWWFRWLAAFAVWVLIFHFINGDPWRQVLVYGAAFATVMTMLFELLDRNRGAG